MQQKTRSLNQLVTKLTKESKVVLVREIFEPLEKPIQNPPTKIGKKAANKPKHQKNRKVKNQIIRIWKPAVGNIVWAKMRGYCLWPGKVSAFEFH